MRMIKNSVWSLAACGRDLTRDAVCGMGFGRLCVVTVPDVKKTIIYENMAVVYPRLNNADSSNKFLH